MRKIINPFEKLRFETSVFDATHNYARFVIEPLERGYGYTIGNALRRVLLMSLPGASVFAIEIEGARHEFSALEGVQEDVTEIVLNLKNLIVRMGDDDQAPVKIEVDVHGDKVPVLTAKHLVVPSGVEIVNPELEIAHLAKDGHLRMFIYVRRGRGYVTAEDNKHIKANNLNIVGKIATDSNYSPVVKNNYTVEPTRVGHSSKYDKLTVEIWTNGSLQPHEALALAGQILVSHFQVLASLSDDATHVNVMKEETREDINKFEEMMIEDLELTVRSYNCLKRAAISSVLELTQKTESEMARTRNLGKKSLKEVKEKLAKFGLSFRDAPLSDSAE
jgi:DNA-directed RNA polymerase subunit alpha